MPRPGSDKAKCHWSSWAVGYSDGGALAIFDARDVQRGPIWLSEDNTSTADTMKLVDAIESEGADTSPEAVQLRAAMLQAGALVPDANVVTDDHAQEQPEVVQVDARHPGYAAPAPLTITIEWGKQWPHLARRIAELLDLLHQREWLPQEIRCNVRVSQSKSFLEELPSMLQLLKGLLASLRRDSDGQALNVKWGVVVSPGPLSDHVLRFVDDYCVASVTVECTSSVLSGAQQCDADDQSASRDAALRTLGKLERDGYKCSVLMPWAGEDRLRDDASIYLQDSDRRLHILPLFEPSLYGIPLDGSHLTVPGGARHGLEIMREVMPMLYGRIHECEPWASAFYLGMRASRNRATGRYDLGAWWIDSTGRTSRAPIACDAAHAGRVEGERAGLLSWAAMEVEAVELEAHAVDYLQCTSCPYYRLCRCHRRSGTERLLRKQNPAALREALEFSCGFQKLALAVLLQEVVLAASKRRRVVRAAAEGPIDLTFEGGVSHFSIRNQSI